MWWKLLILNTVTKSKAQINWPRSIDAVRFYRSHCCQRSQLSRRERQSGQVPQKYFKREQIHVVDGDALIENPLRELRKITNYLGLKRALNETNVYFDKKKGFYCRRMARGRGACLGANKGRTHPKVDKDVLQKWKDYFRPFNQEFYEAVGQNFNW